MSSIFSNNVNLLRLSLEVYGPQITARLIKSSDVLTVFQKQLEVPTVEGDEESVSEASSSLDVMIKFYRDCLAKEHGQLVLRR